MPQPVTLKKLKLNGSMKTYKTFRTNTQKDVLFIPGGWNTKVGSQEIPGVTWNSGLGVQNEAQQRLTESCQDNKDFLSDQCKETEENNRMVLQTPSSNNTREDSAFGSEEVKVHLSSVVPNLLFKPSFKTLISTILFFLISRIYVFLIYPFNLDRPFICFHL